ncbi:MAG: hypothetical protein HZB38_06985 [Planctomycetes bacterium]|nr:hypothetical protein [Planctomycetota bacterium]
MKSPDADGRRVLLILVASVVLGVLVRGLAVAAAPLHSYKPDHRDNMAWSAFAWQHGPQRLYDLAAGAWIIERMQTPTGQVVEIPQRAPHACNYPPLSAYVFWLQGGLWTLLDSNEKTLQLPLDSGLGGASVTSRVIETPMSRLAQATPAMIADVPLALGVAALVAAMRGRRRWGVAEAIAFGIAFVAPPVVLDSAFWNQTDSWISAWMVWTVWALLTGRLTLAGLFWGASLLTKPQAILLAPVVAYYFLARRLESGGSWAKALALWRTAAGVVAAVLVIAGPFMINDANHAEGPLRWFRRSYVATLGAGEYQRTTLNAFNVWWLHRAGSGWTRDALDATQTTWGVSRVLFGKLLLGAAILTFGALAARKWAWRPQSLTAVSAATCLAAFVLPTMVHERYIYYCIPFLIAMAAVRPAHWSAALVLVLIVATCEMLSFSWVRLENASVRSTTVALAVASVAALAATFAALLPRERIVSPDSRQSLKAGAGAT